MQLTFIRLFDMPNLNDLTFTIQINIQTNKFEFNFTSLPQE